MMNPEAPFIRDVAIIALVVGLSFQWTPWLGVGILAVIVVGDGVAIRRERRRARKAEALHRFERQLETARSHASGLAVAFGLSMAESFEGTFEQWPRGVEPIAEIHDEAAALYAPGRTLDRLDHNLDDLR